MSEPNPFVRFGALFDRVVASGMTDPNAMVLATTDDAGRPWTRVVLLKDFDERGLVFFTNLDSRKGRHLAARPDVSLHFFWRMLEARNRQVIVGGRAEPVTDAEADAYFATRPRGSQIGAWASRQSQPLASRQALLDAVAAVESRFPDSVPRPPHWSGFRVVPHFFEFWNEGEFRLHERTVYEPEGDDWRRRLLNP